MGLDKTINFKIDKIVQVSTNDYNNLNNKPTLNGKVLQGNVTEEDPTVPIWAKEPTKPNYTATEVGAVDENDELNIVDLKAIWDSVFI